MPRKREHDKRPAAGIANNVDVQNKNIMHYSNIHHVPSTALAGIVTPGVYKSYKDTLTHL